MTQEAFAALVGATKSMVSKWEKGSVPRREYCERVLAATGGAITPSHFVLNGRKPAPIAKPQSERAATV